MISAYGQWRWWAPFFFASALGACAREPVADEATLPGPMGGVGAAASGAGGAPSGTAGGATQGAGAGALPSGAGAGSGLPAEQPGGLTTVAIKNAPAKVLARITRQQFLNSVAALLGAAAVDGVAPLLPDPVPNVGYSNAGNAQNQTYDVIAGFDDAAKRIVGNVSDWTAVATEYGGCLSYDCAELFVTEFSSRAFRSPVAPEDLAGVMAIVESAQTEGLVYEDALRMVVRALLQAPEFLYLFEDERLTEHQLAARLAYFLTDSPPDEELLLRVDDGSLSSEAVLAQQADRLLAQAGGRFARAFVYDYLGLRRAYQRVNEHDDALLDSLVESAVSTFSGWIERDASASELFLGREFAADETVAEFMGLALEGGQVRPQSNNPFMGIVTHPATLIAMSNAIEGSTVSRGQFIAHQLLCIPPTPPPNAALIAAGTSSTLPEDATERDRGEARLKEPSCMGCHIQFEPYAFAFNKWTGDGVFKDDPRLDDSGPVVTSLGEFAFDGYAEFLPLLAESTQYKRCIADHFLRYGLRHTEYDESLIDTVLSSSGAAVPSFRGLAKAVVLSEPFRSH